MSSVATVRAAPSDGPSADPNATARRSRPVAKARVKVSAATERRAYGMTRRVARERPLARRTPAAPGASAAPRAPAVAPLPIPS